MYEVYLISKKVQLAELVTAGSALHLLLQLQVQERLSRGCYGVPLFTMPIVIPDPLVLGCTAYNVDEAKRAPVTAKSESIILTLHRGDTVSTGFMMEAVVHLSLSNLPITTIPAAGCAANRREPVSDHAVRPSPGLTFFAHADSASTDPVQGSCAERGARCK